ncbi:MAG: Ger(x)C family spore germination protein [Eubacteriales bacterium SKADARSKE-1]|nr:Ger(x)C family spore germination protein [Eubacteriales bacterium SKADARSKE-1]
MKKVSIIIISFLLLVFISGCMQVAQVNEKLIIQAMGVDLSDEEYIITVQALDVESAGGKDLVAAKKVKIFKARGYSIQDAMVNIKSQSGGKPIYSQAILLIMGEEIAKSGVGVFIDFFIRNYDFSPGVNVLVARGKACDILTTKIDEKIITAEKLASISKEGMDANNSVNSNMGQFIGDVKCENRGAIAGYIMSEELDEKNALVVDKIAFFNGDKLVGVLDPEESKGYLFIKGKSFGISDLVYSPDFLDITYTASNSKSKIKVYLQEDKLSVSIDMNVSLYVSESNVGVNCESDSSNIESLVSDRIKDLAKKAIKKSIIDNKTDIFGFSCRFLKFNFQYVKENDLDLVEMLQDAEYNIKVKTKLVSAKSY